MLLRYDPNFDLIAIITLIESQWMQFVNYCNDNEALAETTLRYLKDEAGMS
jgi:hypothetical protein